MFRDLTLAECLKHVATPEQWADYLEVADAPPPASWSWPAGLDFASNEYRKRNRLEHAMFELMRDKLASGDWEAVGRWGETPELIKIDRRLWRTLICDFWSFRYNTVTCSDDRIFAHILISTSISERADNSSKGKAALRTSVRRWLDEHIAAGSLPQRKVEWRKAYRDQFPHSGLTDNLFDAVWDELGQP